MSEHVDNAQTYDRLEALCARVVCTPQHAKTRDRLRQLDPVWTPLIRLVDPHLPDAEMLVQLGRAGYKISVYAVDFTGTERKIITFYCPGLDAIVGSALIDTLGGIGRILH